MLDPKTIVSVTNRSTGSVIYNIPEKNIRREFYPHETKKVAYQEVLDVCAQTGGRELFYEYLLVENKEAIEEATNFKPEPEYYMTEEEIIKWMPTCSLDAFKDALDFAPQGVLDLIKKYAVEMPLNDMEKREAIKTQLKFDVNKAIEINRESKDTEDSAAPAQRRVKPVEEIAEAPAAPARRVITIPNSK